MDFMSFFIKNDGNRQLVFSEFCLKHFLGSSYGRRDQ